MSPELGGQPVLREARAESHSQPGRPVSGNGTLFLTDLELVFEQRFPHSVLRIPRASIVEVSARRAFNLRIFPRLLKVAWTNDSGAQDSIVLTVKEVDEWIGALGRGRSG